MLAALEDADASAQEAALRRACSLCHRSLWTVVAATDAGLLGRVLALLDAERLDASERAGDGRLAAALHLIELLAAHAIDANALRALLALFTRGGTVLLLQALSHAVELSKAAGALGAPPSFFAFDGVGSQLTAALSGPCFGPSAFSVWLWLRHEQAEGGSSGGGADADGAAAEPEVVYAFTGNDGHGVEVSVRHRNDARGAVGGLLTVRVISARGGSTSAQLERGARLRPRCWHWIVIEHIAPERRWSLAALTSAPPAPSVRIYVDGRLALDAALEFPAPTSALRHAAIGAPAALAAAAATSDGRRLRGQLGELLLLPAATGAARVSEVASAACVAADEPRGGGGARRDETVGVRPPARTHRPRLRRAVCQHPRRRRRPPRARQLVHRRRPAVAVAADDDGALAAPRRAGFGPHVRVGRAATTREALECVGGTRVVLLLIGRLQLHASSSPPTPAPAILSTRRRRRRRAPARRRRRRRATRGLRRWVPPAPAPAPPRPALRTSRDARAAAIERWALRAGSPAPAAAGRPSLVGGAV